MKHISKTVWILSLVSLLTDTASEMLYPVMPIYLKSVGFSVILIGVLEGVAEAVAGLSKGYFGELSDASGKRVPFVRIGYAFSAVSKPMMAIFIYPIWIFFARTIDRFGKGIRTAARDAILSDEATHETKGKVFGFHRGMDTVGAVAGPSLALVYLYFFPNDYKPLFLIAFLPGLLAVISTFYLKDKEVASQLKTGVPSFLSFLRYWRMGPAEYRKVVFGLLVFALFNSSDVFLLLKAKESGLDDASIIGLYIFYNLIYALFAFPLGVMADRIGFRSIFILGLALFAVVYLVMALNSNLYVFFGVFFLYGIYGSSTEGVSKAWISNITERKETGTAIGTYAGLQSVCSLLASSLTGLIWYRYGSGAAFVTTAAVTLMVLVYFLTVPMRSIVNKTTKRENR